MKRKSWSKLFLIAIIGISAISCDPFIGRLCGCSEPPLPAPGKMDAHFEERPWLSTDAQAIISDGRITMIANDGSTILFSVEGITPGHYEIKTGKNVIFYTPAQYSVDSASYSTIYSEQEIMGRIDIIDVDEKRKTISGRFEAYLTSGKGTMIPMQGGFSKIPYADAPHNALDGTINDAAFDAAISNGKAEGGKVYANFFQVDGVAINILLPLTVMAGSYEFGEAFSATYISSNAESYEAASGSITIINHDLTTKEISGTLNFEDSGAHVKVTNVSFNVHY